MWTEILLGLITVFLLWRSLKKPSSYPPGRWGLPFLGSLPASTTSVKDEIMNLRKEYGDIALWRIGVRVNVFLFDRKLIKEALSKTELSDRPFMQVFFRGSESDNLGIASSNGLVWQNNRRFGLRLLRNLGMGKSRLAVAIQYEGQCLVEELKKIAGKPVSRPHVVIISVLNIIWQMVAAKRYKTGDPELQKFEEMIANIQYRMQFVVLPDFFPWLMTILPKFLIKKYLMLDEVTELRKKLHQAFMKIVQEHEEKYDPDQPAEDFIDAYLKEMKASSSDPESTFSIKDLLVNLSDLFLGGSETTSDTLTWIFMYLANYPEVQKKLQNQVDEVLPNGKPVTMDDRARLPYVEAVIHEGHRIISLVPFGVMRRASTDIVLNGYTISKGSFVYPALWASHADPELWENPQHFNPDRFLDKEGNFIQPKDMVMPFGSGKRQCFGETLARMELFVFLVTVVQHLHVSAANGKKLDLEPISSSPFANIPKLDQEIIFTPRV